MTKAGFSGPGSPGLFVCVFYDDPSGKLKPQERNKTGCNEETWGLDEAVRRAGSYEAVRKVS